MLNVFHNATPITKFWCYRIYLNSVEFHVIGPKAISIFHEIIKIIWWWEWTVSSVSFVHRWARILRICVGAATAAIAEILYIPLRINANSSLDLSRHNLFSYLRECDKVVGALSFFFFCSLVALCLSMALTLNSSCLYVLFIWNGRAVFFFSLLADFFSVRFVSALPSETG